MEPPPNNGQEITPIRCEEVFQNEMVLEKILDFAIHSGKTVDLQTASNLKLVQRQWLKMVDITLQKAPSSPVFLASDMNLGRIQKFVYCFGTAPRERIPLFHLVIAPPFVGDLEWATTKEMLDTCVACITRCGEGMLSLKVEGVKGLWGPEGEPYHLPAARVNVPRLDKLEITDYGDLCPKMGKFVEWIIDGNQRLTTVTVEKDPRIEALSSEAVEMAFQSGKLPFPKTMNEISLCGSLSASQLDFLRWDPALENLTSLTLRVPLTQLELKSQLHLIFSRFRFNLRKLELNDGSDSKDASILLPVMDRLEELGCSGWSGAQPVEPPYNLGRYLPALKSVTLLQQTFETLRNWIESSNYPFVKTVTVDLEESSVYRHGMLLLQQIDRLNLAMPNVTQLTVGVPFDQQFSLAKYIFQRMVHLQALDIQVCIVHQRQYVTTRTFQALLLGTTPKAGAAVPRGPGNYESVEFDKDSSLVNLTALTKLRLATREYSCGFGPIDAEAAFNVVFFKMPQLQELAFERDFYRVQISQETAREWRAQGRVLLVKA